MIRKIRYRDLGEYLRLRNSCFYTDRSLVPAVRFGSVDRVFFVVNKGLRHFLPIFKSRFNVFGYYVDGKFVGFHHVNQRHILWPYQLTSEGRQVYSELAAVEPEHRGKGILKSFFEVIFRTYKSYDVFDIVQKDNIACLKSTESMAWEVYDEVTRYGCDLRHANLDAAENRGGLVMRRKAPGWWPYVYDLYLGSLRLEAAQQERPKLEYFKISWRYRFNLFLFSLAGFYDEAIYAWTEESTGVMKMFAHVRSNLMTKQTELALIADRHASSEEVLSARTLFAHLADTGQERVTTHVRSNHRSVHDALKNLGFTPEGEYVCRVHKGQENGIAVP